MKSTPDYWIEINRQGSQEYLPKLGSKHEAHITAFEITRDDDSIDFVVLLRGDYRPGTIANRSQILQDYQRYPIENAYQVKI